MAHAGLILDNPVSGERFEFRRTAADTNGELLEFDLTLAADGHVPGAHVHPEQEERFVVHSGTVKFRLGARKIVAGPGDVVVVPAGKVHAFKNVGGEEAKVRVQVTPALDMERLFEATVALAEEGATNRKGMPKPLHLALFVRRFRREVRAPFPPAPIVAAMLAPLAWIATKRGTARATARRSPPSPPSSRSRPDRLERRPWDALDLLEIGVVPAVVRRAADEPRRSVVGHDQAVAAQRGEDDPRLPVETAQRVGPLESQPQPHGRQVRVARARREVPRRRAERAARARHGDPQGMLDDACARLVGSREARRDRQAGGVADVQPFGRSAPCAGRRPRPSRLPAVAGALGGEQLVELAGLLLHDEHVAVRPALDPRVERYRVGAGSDSSAPP